MNGSFAILVFALSLNLPRPSRISTVWHGIEEGGEERLAYRNDETDVVIVLVSIGAWTEEMDGAEGPRLKMHLRTELPA